ncbi:FCD domain-containing protein [Nonomuraea terrae]|uniref:FCD domain-containing protein n=1 Tax=Nonomuraea terrae TaxID=2530383 RepID=UPI0037A1F180
MLAGPSSDISRNNGRPNAVIGSSTPGQDDVEQRLPPPERALRQRVPGAGRDEHGPDRADPGVEDGVEYPPLIAAALSARDRLVHSTGERPGFAATHRAVLDAVREGDPDAAEAATRDLLAQAERDQASL